LRRCADGDGLFGPEQGDMACGEYGPGPHGGTGGDYGSRDGGPDDGAAEGAACAGDIGPDARTDRPRALYRQPQSSGAQGTAIAAALRDLGARVTFVTGPARAAAHGRGCGAGGNGVADAGAVQAALPADAAVMAAAVADWRVANASDRKMKKPRAALPRWNLPRTPIFWPRYVQMAQRPKLVVGFAAETDHVPIMRRPSALRKGCDWIVANDVSPGTGIMGGRRMR
jgi:phosphopantothenoylcysteine decarboxylase / phosphopantothenate---cysteine ligase